MVAACSRTWELAHDRPRPRPRRHHAGRLSGVGRYAGRAAPYAARGRARQAEAQTARQVPRPRRRARVRAAETAGAADRPRAGDGGGVMDCPQREVNKRLTTDFAEAPTSVV